MHKLDLKDRKLLAEIENNARIDNAALGRKIGVSKQVVKYRIERLEKEEIIQGYNAIVDTKKLGTHIYLVYLKLFHITSEQEKAWIEQITTHSKVITVGRNAGRFDLTVVFNCKNSSDFEKTHREVFSKNSKRIKEKIVTTELKSNYLETGLLHTPSKNSIEVHEDTHQLKYDKKDEAVITKLADNCRTSLVDIARENNMSANGVKLRIKNLEKLGIIAGYKTKINYEKLGYLHFRVLLKLNNYSNSLYNKIVEFLKNESGCESVSKYIGYADLDFRYYSENMIRFYAFISKTRDMFVEEIIEIESMPIFNWEQINYHK